MIIMTLPSNLGNISRTLYNGALGVFLSSFLYQCQLQNRLESILCDEYRPPDIRYSPPLRSYLMVIGDV
jgi:hypothetical protein